jgi:hypothetical protein
VAAPGPPPTPGPGAKPPSYTGGAPLYNKYLSGTLAYTFYPNAVPPPKRIKPFGPVGYPLIQYTPSGSPAGGAPVPPLGAMGTVGGPMPTGITVKPTPLAGVSVRLVARYRSGVGPVTGTIVTVGGKTYTDVGKVVATATTGADGHFTFLFHDDAPTGQIGFLQPIHWGSGDFQHDESAGSLFRYYSLEVQDGHFLSPSDELTSDAPNGDLGTLVSLVRFYQLKVRVMRLGSVKIGQQTYSVPVEVLPQVRVQLLRVYRPTPIPVDEGATKPPRKTVSIPGYLGIPTPAEIIDSADTKTDGTVVFTRLVKNVGTNDSYLIRAYTDSNTSGQWYWPAIVSYKNAWGLSPTTPKPWDWAQVNEQYNTNLLDSIFVTMDPRPPRIAGKLTRADNSQPIAKGWALITRQGGPIILRTVTNARFAADNVPPATAANPYHILAHSDGFKGDSATVNMDLTPGQQWYREFALQPAARIKARFVDETGTPIAAWMRIGPKTLAPLIQSHAVAFQAQGFGNLQYLVPTAYGVDTIATTGAAQPLHVEMYPDYYPLDSTVTIGTGTNDLGTLRLVSKQRRVIVRVLRGSGGNALTLPGGSPAPPVVGARIRVDATPGDSGVTAANGTVLLEWKGGASATTTATVFVAGPANQEYVPQTATCLAPETKTPPTCTVHLPPAARVTGVVYAGPGTTAPVAGARVFVPDRPDITTTADPSGHYILHSVPLDTKTLAAGKAASGLIADFHAVTLSTPETPGVDFHLTHYEGIDITKLLGFPLEVHQIAAAADGDGVMVSGALIAPANPALAPEVFGAPVTELALAFENVRIRAAGGGSQTAVPDGDSVPLVDPTLLMRMYGSFKVRQGTTALTVRPRSPGVGAVYGPLEVRRAETFATTSAGVSFTGPQGQDAPLFLLMPGATGAARTVLPSLTADAGSPAPTSGFNLGSPNAGPSQLKINGGQGGQFDVDADPAQSFARADGAHFRATVHTAIPSIGDLALTIADMVVKPGAGLQTAGGSDTVKANLDQWKLRAFGWSLTTSGIQFPKGDITAEGVAFPYTAITVLPNDLQGGTIAATQITLGSVVPFTPSGAITFLHEAGGPWKLAAAGGSIAGLPGFPSGQAIQIGNWALYSDGQHTFATTGNTIRLYQTADFKAGALTAGDGIVSIIGSLDLVAPAEANLGPAGVTLYYQKNSAGQITAKLTGADWQNVDIGGPKLNIANGQLGPSGFTAGGSIDIPGAFSVATTFTRTPITATNKISAVPTPDAAIKIGELAITQVKGGATLNSPWKTAFQGALTSLGDQLGGELSFDVAGANVTVGTAGLTVKNISTPFGNVALVLNFPEKRLDGSLQVNHMLSAGAYADGTVNLAISGKPGDRYWYFLGGVNFGLTAPPQLSATAAILIGDAHMKQPQIATFNSYATKPLPSDFYDIKGFFVAGKASVGLIVVDCPNGEIDLGIAYIGAGCEIWADARFGMNFEGANVYRLGMGFGARAWAKGGVSMGVCISVSGEAKYYNEYDGAYKSDGAWYVEGTGAYSLSVTFEYGVGALGVCLSDTDTESATLGVDAQIGNDWVQGDGPHFKIFWQ